MSWIVDYDWGCVFCDFKAHSKELVLRHIRNEHQEKIIKKVNKKDGEDYSYQIKG